MLEPESRIPWIMTIADVGRRCCGDSNTRPGMNGSNVVLKQRTFGKVPDKMQFSLEL